MRRGRGDHRPRGTLRTAQVQEGVHDANVGAVPRSLTVILEDDLVDVCRAGDDVHITGASHAFVRRTARSHWRASCFPKQDSGGCSCRSLSPTTLSTGLAGVLEVRWLGGLRLEQRCQVW